MRYATVFPFYSETLNNVVLTFESLGDTQVCDHSNESYWEVLSCGTVYYAVKSSF